MKERNGEQKERGIDTLQWLAATWYWNSGCSVSPLLHLWFQTQSRRCERALSMSCDCSHCAPSMHVSLSQAVTHSAPCEPFPCYAAANMCTDGSQYGEAIPINLIDEETSSNHCPAFVLDFRRLPSSRLDAPFVCSKEKSSKFNTPSLPTSAELARRRSFSSTRRLLSGRNTTPQPNIPASRKGGRRLQDYRSVYAPQPHLPEARIPTPG